RSWVASFGVDTNDCTRPAPCRTFGRAVTVSNPGAEVVVMDSAGYGPVTIDKAISIIAPPSVHAAIAPPSGDAITIATGIAFPVILRGLYLNGQGGTIGIVQQGNNDLHVERCVINGFSGGGIVFQTAVQPHFFINDTTISNNDGHGILWQGGAPGGGTIDHCRLERNSGSGLAIESGGDITIRDT